MPGRQKSGAEAPMDSGGRPASSPKARLAGRRKQMSRRRRKGMRGTPLEKRYGCMEDSKGAREKAKGAKRFSFEACSRNCARRNRKVSLDRAVKTIQKGLWGFHSPTGETAKERFLICLSPFSSQEERHGYVDESDGVRGVRGKRNKKTRVSCFRNEIGTLCSLPGFFRPCAKCERAIVYGIGIRYRDGSFCRSGSVGKSHAGGRGQSGRYRYIVQPSESVGHRDSRKAVDSQREV